MTIEELDAALTHKNIKPFSFPPKDGVHFERRRGFSVGDDYYMIEWYCNVSYLTCGKLLMVFDTVRQSNTWPNHSKMNLQFSYDGKTCGIIPIEAYNEQ